MTTKATTLADMLKQADLPLAAGAVERAEVACLGLPATVRVHEEDFTAIVQLLAHRESQGFTWLGFNDCDAVECDRYDEVDPPEDAEDPSDFHIAFTDYHPYWDLVLSIYAASTAEKSPFMVEFTAPIRAHAEFVIDEKAKRLMFARAADNDLRLWESIRARAAAPASVLPAASSKILDDLFPQAAAGTNEAKSREEQIAAATLIATRQLSVLTGPPGTGKTFTIVRAALTWLCNELEMHATDATNLPRTIMLMAPTGRAKSRMRELIEEALAKLEANKAALAALGPHGPAAIAELREAGTSTIHSALGYSTLPGRPFKRNRDNRLDVGLVIADETSMLGLELARRLFDALPDDAQICLVGDPGQLRAVEMGSVLYDVVREARADKTISACHAALTISRRFPPGSMIDKLATAIRSHDGDPKSASLADLLVGKPLTLSDLVDNLASLLDTDGGVSEETHVFVVRVPEPELAAAARKIIALQTADRHCHVDEEPKSVLKRSITLSPVRQGPVGAYTLADTTLAKAKGPTPRNPWDYPDGTQIIINRNNRDLGLANGDLAIIRQTVKRTEAVFPDGRTIDIRMLPSFQPAAALTVHKAQGSEWHSVVVILPPRHRTADLQRLLYTAVTRALTTVTLVVSTGPLPKS
jgi:exodeoxyribonuclease V alpha subunit